MLVRNLFALFLAQTKLPNTKLELSHDPTICYYFAFSPCSANYRFSSAFFLCQPVVIVVVAAFGLLGWPTKKPLKLASTSASQRVPAAPSSPGQRPNKNVWLLSAFYCFLHSSQPVSPPWIGVVCRNAGSDPGSPESPLAGLWHYKSGVKTEICFESV